ARSRALSKNPGASPPHSFRRPRAGGAITVSYNRGGGQLSVRFTRAEAANEALDACASLVPPG
ncbi:MAG: hypothetical protein ACK58T_27570, partial [Phycisphaerae bacterium]